MLVVAVQILIISNLLVFQRCYRLAINLTPVHEIPTYNEINKRQVDKLHVPLTKHLGEETIIVNSYLICLFVKIERFNK
jgi:hypothetical protein